jgi:hypothetical protein
MATYPGGIFGNDFVAQPQIHPSGPQFNNDATAVNPIGGRIRWNNLIWRYVKHSAGTGTVTPLAGAPAYPKVLTPAATSTAVPVFTVTADQSDGVGNKQAVGVYGQFTTAPTDGYYTWIVCGGVPQALVAGAVAGDTVIASATDNQFDRIASGSNVTQVPQGTVMGSSSSGLSPVLLMGMDW